MTARGKNHPNNLDQNFSDGQIILIASIQWRSSTLNETFTVRKRWSDIRAGIVICRL